MTQNDLPRIRVLRIVTRLNIGGPSKQIEVLHNQLDSSDFEQLLVTGKVPANEAPYESINSDKIVEIKCLTRESSLLQDFVSTVEVARIAKKFKPNIIHTHQSKAWIIGYFAKFLLRSHVKLIHTFHGHVLHSYFPPMKQFLIRLISKKLAKNTDALIAVSEETKRELLYYKVGFGEKISVIYPGFDFSSKLEFDTNQSLVFPEKKILQILFLGRLEPIKDPFFLLDVCSRLKSHNIPFVLRVVGGGTLLKEFREKVDQLQLPVEFEGWQSNLHEIFRDVDLLVMCSKNEGTPIAIIEAGMFGIPTLTNDVGGIRELIPTRDQGFIVDKDVNAYYNFLAGFLDMKKEIFNVDSISNFYLSKFTSRKFIDSHENLYKNVILLN